MGSLARLFVFFCGVLFVGIIMNLLVKRKISERNSMIWLLGTIIMLVLSAFPGLLDKVAGFIGIDYPPALLFFLSTLVVLYLLLNQSIQISILSERVRELAQNSAIQQAMEKGNSDQGSEQRARKKQLSNKNVGEYSD